MSLFKFEALVRMTLVKIHSKYHSLEFKFETNSEGSH